uniref:cAMP-regulated phosphoprotein 19 n=1 Tax=Acrobeloides nanus TaxID=290746 RepID=A0A914CTY8_9BILA
MRGEVRDELKTENIANEGDVDVEKQQEILLMNKLASAGKLPPKPQSNFLQKKLQQRKFFDSGDYAMNKDKEQKHQRPVLLPPAGVKKPEGPPAEAAAAAVASTNDNSNTSSEEEHLQIPNPENVPARKASIIHPSVHSKLSPQPHLHHEHNPVLEGELSSPPHPTV